MLKITGSMFGNGMAMGGIGAFAVLMDDARQGPRRKSSYAAIVAGLALMPLRSSRGIVSTFRPFQGDRGLCYASRKSRSLQGFGPGEQQPGSKGGWTFDDEHTSQGARVWGKNRPLQCK